MQSQYRIMKQPTGELTAIKIGEESGLGRLPAKNPARDGVRCRGVQRDQIRKEPEVARQHQHVRGNRHGRQIQPGGNGFGDLAVRYSHFGDCMPASARGTFFQRQTKHAGEVTGMHGPLTVGTVCGVADDPLFLGQPDQ